MTIFTNKFLKYFNNRYHQTYDELYDGMDAELIGEKKMAGCPGSLRQRRRY